MGKQSEAAVPRKMQPVFDEIVAITDAFCRERLNEEYVEICQRLTAALCRKRPSPLLHGHARVWAAGIVWTAGWINFLSDPSQTPHMTQKEMAEKFGISTSSMAARKKVIDDALGLMQLDPRYTLSSLMAENPLAWLIEVNDLVIDARMAPREVQEIAYEKGLIPYIPGDTEPADVEWDDEDARGPAA
jgi:hypothetical protein